MGRSAHLGGGLVREASIDLGACEEEVVDLVLFVDLPFFNVFDFFGLEVTVGIAGVFVWTTVTVDAWSVSVI